MFPVICKIGPITFYSYGLLLAIAVVVSSIFASMRSRVENINPEIIFNLSFLSFIFGIIGARIFYIIENFHYYFKNPLEMIMLQHGGLSWYGGLAAGIIFAVLYIKKRNLALYKILDLISPFLALGQAIGRIGCLLNGCCFGKVSRFGLYFQVQNNNLIPTQIYSSLILLFIFAILRFLQDRPHQESQIFLAYLLLYALKRFLIEFWRADNPIIFVGLTLFQLISLAIFVFSVIRLFSLTKIKKKNAGI